MFILLQAPYLQNYIVHKMRLRIHTALLFCLYYIQGKDFMITSSSLSCIFYVSLFTIFFRGRAEKRSFSWGGAPHELLQI